MSIPEPRVTEADVRAMLAVMSGEATADQQRHAIGWIIQEACHFEGAVPDDAVGTPHHAHHEGRRYVAGRILLMRLPATLEIAQRRDAADMTQKFKATTPAAPRRGPKP